MINSGDTVSFFDQLQFYENRDLSDLNEVEERESNAQPSSLPHTSDALQKISTAWVRLKDSSERTSSTTSEAEHRRNAFEILTRQFDQMGLNSPFEHLKVLDLTGSATPSDLEALASARTLKFLDLTNCQYLTDQHLQGVARLEHLELINLTRCSQITHVGLSHLKALNHLQTLIMVSSGATCGAGIAALNEFGDHLEILIAGYESRSIRVDSSVHDPIKHDHFLQLAKGNQFAALGVINCPKVDLEGCLSIRMIHSNFRVLGLIDRKCPIPNCFTALGKRKTMDPKLIEEVTLLFLRLMMGYLIADTTTDHSVLANICDERTELAIRQQIHSVQPAGLNGWLVGNFQLPNSPPPNQAAPEALLTDFSRVAISGVRARRCGNGAIN